jgi:hypothetical protein
LGAAVIIKISESILALDSWFIASLLEKNPTLLTQNALNINQKEL